MLKFFLKLFLKLELSSCFSRLTDVTRLDYAKKMKTPPFSSLCGNEISPWHYTKILQQFSEEEKREEEEYIGEGEGARNAGIMAWLHFCTHRNPPRLSKMCSKSKMQKTTYSYSPRWNLKILSWRFQVATELISVGQWLSPPPSILFWEASLVTTHYYRPSRQLGLIKATLYSCE